MTLDPIGTFPFTNRAIYSMHRADVNHIIIVIIISVVEGIGYALVWYGNVGGSENVQLKLGHCNYSAFLKRRVWPRDSREGCRKLNIPPMTDAAWRICIALVFEVFIGME